jgi:hypothetical protein
VLSTAIGVIARFHTASVMFEGKFRKRLQIDAS